MMGHVDWSLLAFGGVVGFLVGGLFFAGLAVGVRRAMLSVHALAIFSISAVLRIAACVGAAWLVLMQLGLWGFAGFGIGFVLSRRVATYMVGGRVAAKGAP